MDKHRRETIFTMWSLPSWERFPTSTGFRFFFLSLEMHTFTQICKSISNFQFSVYPATSIHGGFCRIAVSFSFYNNSLDSFQVPFFYATPISKRVFQMNRFQDEQDHRVLTLQRFHIALCNTGNVRTLERGLLCLITEWLGKIRFILFTKFVEFFNYFNNFYYTMKTNFVK